MQEYERAVEALVKLPHQDPLKEPEQHKIQMAAGDIVSSLKSSHKPICEKDPQGGVTRKLLTRLAGSHLPQYTVLLREILQILYLKESPLLAKAVYPAYPVLLRRFIESQQSKSTQLDQLLRLVFANQSGSHTRFLREREEVHRSPFVRDLYAIHFDKPKAEQDHLYPLEKSMEMEESQSSTADKRAIKSLLLCLIYRNLPSLDPPALQEYLKAIFVYCGGDSNAYSASSFYLLQKRNAFNLFRYSISEPQIQWMLLALYELAVGTNSLKFQLLAAIHMIYKKTANESMFKYSQIAQSIIHLLEEEYTDVFG